MSTIPTNRESDRFMLRLPDGMRDRIKTVAEANNRSMNAEIVATLEKAYPEESVDEAIERFLRIADELIAAFGDDYPQEVVVRTQKLRDQAHALLHKKSTPSGS